LELTHAESAASAAVALEERFTIRESRRAVQGTSRTAKECPECRTVTYGNPSRCSACARDLTGEREIGSFSGLIPYLLFALGVGTFLALGALYYR
jgi:hypothetical protein